MRGCSRGGGGWGACVVAPGGHAWLLLGGHAWLLPGGACVVLFGVCAWFYSGGMHGFIWRACVVAPGGHPWFYSGGMRGFIRGVHGFIWEACMVLFGDVRGFIQGGVRGFIQGGMRGFSSFFGYNEIRSMSGRYASYWNAFLLIKDLDLFEMKNMVRKPIILDILSRKLHEIEKKIGPGRRVPSALLDLPMYPSVHFHSTDAFTLLPKQIPPS